MRKMASVQKILAVKPIEGADLIVAYQVKGWWVVDKKDAYQVGDMVVYCEVDSWIPTELAPFLSKGKEPRIFNEVRGEKLKTVRLKGQLSQGLLLPLSPACDTIDTDIVEDCDVSVQLNIQKWELPETGSLGGNPKGTFPSHTPKTDQERVQNLGKTLTSLWTQKDWAWEVTEKLEGSSCTIFHFEGETGVCSRNQELKEDENNSFWKVARKYDLPNKLKTLGLNLSIQGELVGPGVQGNIYKLNELDLFIYDVYDINSGLYYNANERQVLCQELGLKHTPVIRFMTMENQTIDSLLELADGKSKINPAVNREGLVFKCVPFQASFKAISNAYLLKQG